MLCVVCCLLFVACCLLFVGCCLLFVVCCLLFVPSDGVFPRAFRVSFPTVNKGFRAIFDDLRAGLEQWAYVAFTGTLS